MDAADLMFAGPLRQAELVREGAVTPRQLVEASLERIEQLDGRLNAFRVVLADEARAEADALGSDPAGRPLFGIPVAVKDEMEVAGQTTQYGTPLDAAPDSADAELVRRLREAGAVVVGKTNVPELMVWPFTDSPAHGLTRNPWNPERTAGGSSGGSAVAVASGMVGLATAGDGLGSIRIPAACCGLVGLKAQRDRISPAPHQGSWYAMTHFGVLTRSVADTAAVLDVVADRPPPEPFAQAASRPPGELRIAYSFRVPPLLRAKLTPDVREAVLGVAELLRSLGHSVSERPAPFEARGTVEALLRWQRGIHDHAEELGVASRLTGQTRGMVQRGRLVLPAVARASMNGDGGRARRVGRFFEDVDVLITPVLTSAALPAEHLRGRGTTSAMLASSAFAPFPGPWNLTGQPACSVPAGFTDEGLPLAVQLIGRTDDEATVLALAAQIESERPWADRRPPIS